MHQFAIVGGGIVGVATALRLSEVAPGARVVLLEKEAELASHQTGNNSGVIHSGIYYKPGSAKARFSLAGQRSMVEFCQRNGIAYETCGKLIVACDETELAMARTLEARGKENNVALEWLTPEQVREREPHVRCLGAILVPSTGITSYRQVVERMASRAKAAGVEIVTGQAVRAIRAQPSSTVVETQAGASFETEFVINCAGLHSDRIARLAGVDPKAQIVPFRGEYYELVPERRSLVKHLIYPVPNPAFPFLGVHFTRMIDGTVHAGPNAVLSLKREGYTRYAFDPKDFADTMSFSGFWRLASRHFSYGMKELARSWLKPLFVKSLQRLIPEVSSADLTPCRAGVRAQALLHDGRLVDDFLLVEGPRSMHVLNAPSPAATCSIEIAREIVSRVAVQHQTPFSSRSIA